jgi:hypothetical protein
MAAAEQLSSSRSGVQVELGDLMRAFAESHSGATLSEKYQIRFKKQ